MTHHHLPGEGPDSDWFGRYNAFEQQETLRQVKFKRKQWPSLNDGQWSKDRKRTYPHILPEGHFEKALYDPIAGPVQSYCQQYGIAWHTEALNLRSSQVSCFNVIFPFRQDPALAADVLSPLLPGVKTVTAVEFEYTGDPGATPHLGEPKSGGRGQNRTSIDVAIWWTDNADRRRLTLGEWKYTEHSFGSCGGYVSRGNPNRIACETLDPSVPDAPSKCYLTSPRHHRNYWKHLASAGIDVTAFGATPGCPFRGPYYQVMRQFLLAAYLRTKGDVDVVDVAAIVFRGNDKVVGYEQKAQEWNLCLVEVPPLRLVYVDDVVAAIRADARCATHAAYLMERYGL